MDAVSQTNFEFSSALLEKLATGSENLAFSPFSLSLILLLARFGARGRTGAQIEQVLRLSGTEHLDGLNQTGIAFRAILDKILTPTDDGKVTVANNAFMQKDFRFSEEFKNISTQRLKIGLGLVNFTDGSSASDRINGWVMKKTEGKFPQLFSPDSFGADTKLVLVNAIYFKSPWKYPFEPKRSRKAPFYIRPRDKTIVDMMVAEDSFPYGNLAELNAKIVSIPYKGDRFSMQVIIPKERQQTIEDLLLALKGIKMNTIQASLRTPGNCEEVRLHLPKFKIESKHDLVEPLKQMGAIDMFSATEADFSGIPRNGATKLSVSEVIQKAYIAVDEEGTEAAAATGMQVGVMCLPSVTEIRANRPFYYQIVEHETNTVLFAGVVRNPKA